MGKLYIVCPPFVQGGIEQTLADHVIDTAHHLGIDYVTFGYHSYGEPKEGNGFYNNATWMRHCTRSVMDLMAMITRDQDEGSVILFNDFWYPGIDTIRTHLKLLKLDYPITAWLHGASFVPGDLMQGDPYPAMEKAWLSSIDTLWVASEFFAQGVPEGFKSKVRITGSPFELSKYAKMPRVPFEDRDIDIILPCRFAEDKIDVELLWKVATTFKGKRIVITTKRPEDIILPANVEFIFDQDEKDHLARLSQAKVVFSMATQEGWGYGVMKAVALGCCPVLPNKAVYPELYPSEALYETDDDCIALLRKRLEKPKDMFYTLRGFSMYKAMKEDPNFSSLFGGVYR